MYLSILYVKFQDLDKSLKDVLVNTIDSKQIHEILKSVVGSSEPTTFRARYKVQCKVVIK